MTRARLSRIVLILLLAGGVLLGDRLGLIPGIESLQDIVNAPVSAPDAAAQTQTAPVASSAVAAASLQPAVLAEAKDGRVCGSAELQDTDRNRRLLAFARDQRLNYPTAFVHVVTSLHETGRLPRCYRTKREAGDAGWDRGEALWDDVPRTAIGGDRFGNRERLLPARYDGTYREADIDYAGSRRRNTKRIVYSTQTRGDNLIWLTTDHYDSFTQVPQL